MHRSILLLVFFLLIAITGMQALRSLLSWYSPFLVALGVIVLAALLQLPPRHDDV
jgi:purine-cytosine permease-like protein